jgi:hypothetical protein
LKRITKIGGEISIVMPTDPGVLNQILKKLYSYRKIKKLSNVNPKLIYALEHRNHVGGILELIKFVFKNDDLKFRFRPFYVKSWNLNLWINIHIKIKTNFNREDFYSEIQ